MMILEATGIPANVFAGAVSALVAVAVGTRVRDVGWRNYLLVAVSAALAAAALVERYLLGGTLFQSCITGWVIGYLADDVVMTANSIVPEFVRTIAGDTLAGIRKWLRRWFD